MKRAVNPIFAAIMLVLSLAAPVAAGQLEDATAAYQRRDYATALRLYRPLADQGDARAQTMLGGMYGQGLGVPQDYAEAVKWYRLAANQGYADAQYNRGVAYANGRGVPQDYAKAARWFRLASNQGNAGAQASLRLMYDTGLGVPQDYAEATKWYRKAADQGDPSANTCLGPCTSSAGACRRTTSSHTCGATWRRRRAINTRQKIET